MSKQGTKLWIVPYEVVHRGWTTVEATTAEAAKELVEEGRFDEHPGQEVVNWKATGRARAKDE